MTPRNPDNQWTSDALQRGDSEAVRRKILENPEYIHDRDFIGDTPLLTAIAFADVELEMMKQALQGVDRAQSYIDSANEIVRTGNHAEVIRILSELRR
ncbi:MAG: hypothetical protein EA381_12730 [Planctomycetaceae bacterium]|nr:MAG: hypothetical protein EA381_12730 [Planctomycetaceae bacterium]